MKDCLSEGEKFPQLYISLEVSRIQIIYKWCYDDVFMLSKTRILLQFLLPVFIGCEKFEKIRWTLEGVRDLAGDLLPALAVSHGVFDGPNTGFACIRMCGLLVGSIQKSSWDCNGVQQDLDQRQRGTFPDRNEMFILMTQTTWNRQTFNEKNAKKSRHQTRQLRVYRRDTSGYPWGITAQFSYGWWRRLLSKWRLEVAAAWKVQVLMFF